ncbi:MAG: phage holin family protein [Parcubacteria group bacterium]
MNFIGKSIIIALVNMGGIYLAERFIPGFSAPTGIYSLAVIALIFTGLNLVIKPLLKLALKPIAWLTFGLSSLAINMGLLFVLDYLREDVIINGLVPLILGTLLISFVNLICERLILPKS